MNDKKVTQSITMLGGFLTLLWTGLMNFGVLPDGSTSATGDITAGLTQTAQGIFALVTLYGVRRKMGER